MMSGTRKPKLALLIDRPLSLAIESWVPLARQNGHERRLHREKSTGVGQASREEST